MRVSYPPLRLLPLRLCHPSQGKTARVERLYGPPAHRGWCGLCLGGGGLGCTEPWHLRDWGDRQSILLLGNSKSEHQAYGHALLWGRCLAGRGVLPSHGALMLGFPLQVGLLPGHPLPLWQPRGQASGPAAPGASG